MRQTLAVGYGTFGVPFVKFTLTYEGSLPSSGNTAKKEAKWAIRNAFHPQLKDLWASHPALRQIELNERYFPKVGGAQLTQTHHLHPGPTLAAPTPHLVMEQLHQDGPYWDSGLVRIA